MINVYVTAKASEQYKYHAHLSKDYPCAIRQVLSPGKRGRPIRTGRLMHCSPSLSMFSCLLLMRIREMGVVTGNEGVLKLVYPGRFVEIHKEPITAAEVMKKNPRHYVTRPDVFEYPWIVVRPESVLHLGRVFFIVPNHTLNKLLKAGGYHRHNHKQSLQESQSSIEYARHQEVLELASSIKSFAGVTPKYHKSWQFQNQFLHTLTWERENSEEYVCGERFQSRKPLFQAISLDKVSPQPQEHVYGGKRFQPNNKLFQTSSSDRECSQKQFWGERFHGQSLNESLAEVTTRHQHAHQKFNKKSQTDSMIFIRTPHYEDCNSSRAACNTVEEDYVLLNKCRNDAIRLKSCLRKHDSVRKLLISWFRSSCQSRMRN